jgi:hypothetical protein
MHNSLQRQPHRTLPIHRRTFMEPRLKCWDITQLQGMLLQHTAVAITGEAVAITGEAVAITTTTGVKWSAQ